MTVTLTSLYWENPIDAEWRNILFFEEDDSKTLYMITRPFHPIKVIYRVMKGKEIYWQGLLIDLAVDRYNEI